MQTFLSVSNLADLTGTSIATVQKWGENGVYPLQKNVQGKMGFFMEDLKDIQPVKEMLESKWNDEFNTLPLRDYTSVELFAGAGGLALGMHKAGFRHVLLNEMDPMACRTLRLNHPEWNVLEGDIHNVDFTPLHGKVDFLSGGFPCQAFSYAGKKGGLNDTRGTLFFELARAVKEIQPKVFMGENVKGLFSHDGGRTMEIIRNAISELGYTLIEPKVLKAIMYQVPQKRERLILLAIRNDIAEKVNFHWPDPYCRVMTLRDAFCKGDLFPDDVPLSEGQSYPEKKARVMAMVPEGGDWRNLPVEEQKAYMGGSFFLGGGKTGMARRLAMDEPSLTLTCAPAQKQTERCHPTETRPLTIREYARIQTFPDDWRFVGKMTDQYKQIGNAVPVNLAYAVGRSVIRLLNELETKCPEKSCFEEANKAAGKMLPPQLLAIDIFDLKQAYPEIVFENSYVLNDGDDDQLDFSKNVLVSLVKGDDAAQFNDRSARIYYSGKQFPSTVDLNKLHYFMPYTKNKGVRDLYIINAVRVGTKCDMSGKSKDKDLRLIFDIEYLCSLFKDYRHINLDIWQTFKDTVLSDLMCK